jgi:hypothetical protein
MSPKIRTFIFYLRTSYFRVPSFLDSTIIRAFKLGFYFLMIYTIHSQLTYIFSFFICFVFSFHTSLSIHWSAVGQVLVAVGWQNGVVPQGRQVVRHWCGVAGVCGRASQSRGHWSYIVGVCVLRSVDGH